MLQLEGRSVVYIPPPPTLTFDLDLPKFNHLVPCFRCYVNHLLTYLLFYFLIYLLTLLLFCFLKNKLFLFPGWRL